MNEIDRLSRRELDGVRRNIGDAKLNVRRRYKIDARRRDFGIDSTGWAELRALNVVLDRVNARDEWLGGKNVSRAGGI